ncbi:MAG: hypothetical protein IVW55_01130 [Chloroflexi bacterium]|nr:hypothetical protein [Chloroflexota bacterium]
MALQELITNLDREWELETGFFGRLRSSEYDPEGANRVTELLQRIADAVENEGQLDRRLVSLTWFMPTFISWQRQRVEERTGNGKALDSTLDTIVSILQRVLGMP